MLNFMLFICEWIYFFICIMFLQWRVHSLYKINDWIGNQLGNSSTTNSEMSQMSNHKIIQFIHRVCSFQFQFQFLKFKWFGAPKWNSAFLVNFDVKESDRGKNEYIHFGVGWNRSQCLVMYYIAIDLHCFHYWPLSFSNIKKIAHTCRESRRAKNSLWNVACFNFQYISCDLFVCNKAILCRPGWLSKWL